MDRSRLIAVARGEDPADVVLTNAQVVNVFSGSVETADVAIAEGCVAGVGDYADAPAERRLDLSGKYLAPTYMDAHIHLESTMLLPVEFARAVLPHGSTCTVSDPHEIANVAGLAGIRLLMALAEGLPFDFYFTLSSCVPATHLETSGATLAVSDLEELIGHPRMVALAEMMNFPGVLFRVPEVLAKLDLAHRHGKPADGHAPLLGGRDLNAYIASGISSDHECTQLEEAREKLARGMWVFLREGSTEKNLAELLPLVNETTAARCCLVTDDRHPDELLKLGHLNYTVYLAVTQGMNPATAIRLATLNPATYFGLRYRGAIAPGYAADVQVLRDLKEGLLRPLAVYKSGALVAENGGLAVELPRSEVPAEFLHTIRVPRKLSAEDFVVPGNGGSVRIIKVIPHQIVTDAVTAPLPTQDGKLLPDPSQDILKLAVVERYSGEARHSVGFVQGFGLKSGALASSVAHDSHNIVAVGASDAEIAVAVNEVAAMQGGLVVVKEASILAQVPLPVAGLMALEDAPTIAKRTERLLLAARDELGCRLDNPFMTLSFLALPVIPRLRLTDRGLVDVDKFAFVPLSAEECS